MKTKILYIFFFISYSALSQNTILPLNATRNDVPENSYLKDVNNELNAFVGVWSYQQGQKKITIKFEKLIDHNSIGNYYYDSLKGRYKVENGSTIVYNDLNETMLSGDISGKNFREGHYHLSYWDEKECRLLYQVKIKIDPNNTNKLIWEMYGDETVAFNDDCARMNDPDWGTVSTLPVNMVLTRQ